MQANIDEQRDALIDVLLAAGIPNVWEQTVPAGDVLPRQNGIYLPYAIISFGGFQPVSQDMQGITGSRDDLKWTSVAVQSIGASPRDARTVETIVRDTLEGYNPGPGWGLLREQLSDAYSVKVPDFELWPVRHARTVVFNANVGA